MKLGLLVTDGCCIHKCTIHLSSVYSHQEYIITGQSLNVEIFLHSLSLRFTHANTHTSYRIAFPGLH